MGKKISMKKEMTWRWFGLPWISILALSGCLHPCQLNLCSEFTTAIAFMGHDGYLYIDVPELKASPSAKVLNIAVTKQFGNDNSSRCCWEISFQSGSPANIVFPIRYGQNANGIKTLIYPSTIEPGAYLITGDIVFPSEYRNARIIGKFTHDGRTAYSE